MNANPVKAGVGQTCVGTLIGLTLGLMLMARGVSAQQTQATEQKPATPQPGNTSAHGNAAARGNV